MKQVIRIPGTPSICRCCGATHSAHSGDALPEAGDVSVCASCLTPSVFTDACTTRGPQDDGERLDCARALAEVLAGPIVAELEEERDRLREDLVSVKAALDAAHSYRDQLEAERDQLRADFDALGASAKRIRDEALEEAAQVLDDMEGNYDFGPGSEGVLAEVAGCIRALKEQP